MEADIAWHLVSGSDKNMEFGEMLQLIQGGGNVALCVCAVFIYRASERLARIEKALDKYMVDKS